MSRRDIKFKAWDGNEMHDDFVIVSPKITSLGCAINDGIRDLQENSENWIILQFTGFKDKHREDLYEGDVVSIASGQTYYITFEKGGFICYHAQLKDVINGGNLRWGLLSRAYELGELFEFTRIGNIYENPELLK